MADLAVSLQLNAEDLLSPQVNRALRAVQQLQRGVQSLNGTTAQAGGGAAGGGALGQQAQRAQQQVGGLNDALQQLLPNIAQVGLRAGPWVGLALGVGAVTARTHQLRLETERARQTLSAFAESGAAVDEMMTDAQRNAMQTGKSLGEVQAAQASLASVGRTPAQMRQMVELAERLAVLAPEQGIQGAAFAIREASANQFESAVDRMNISRQAINRLRAAGVEGTDVLVQALDEMGVTMEDVTRQGEGLEGQTNRLSTAFDALLIRATSPAWDQLEAQMKRINDQLSPDAQGKQTPTGQALTDAATALGAIGGVAAAVGGLIVQGVLAPIIGLDTLIAGALDISGRLRARAAEEWKQQYGMGLFPGGREAAGAAPPPRAPVPLVPTRFPETGGLAIAGSTAALDDYLRELDRLTQMDEGLREHARSWGSIQTRITAATNQVDFFGRRIDQLQQAGGFAGGLRGELQRARTLERRMGTYGGEYDAAIVDLYRREHGYTLGEGSAALQAYLAAQERERQGGEFAADRVRVDEQHVEAGTVYVNGGTVIGAAAPSRISGSGLPSGGPPRGRYEQGRGAWQWTPGQMGIGRAIG